MRAAENGDAFKFVKHMDVAGLRAQGGGLVLISLSASWHVPCQLRADRVPCHAGQPAGLPLGLDATVTTQLFSALSPAPHSASPPYGVTVVTKRPVGDAARTLNVDTPSLIHAFRPAVSETILTFLILRLSYAL